MLQSAIILFRESLEAALIITIVLGATRGLPHRGRWVTFGILAGIGGSLVVAAFAQQLSGLAAGTGQELFNAAILLTATAMLGWHNIWMAGHGRKIAAKAGAVGRQVSEGERHMGTLAVVVGLAVLREGSEVVLFLAGIFAAGGQAMSMLTGSLMGLAAGAACGLILYFGLVRIPIKHFFTVTGWLILLLAAGLAAQAAGFLVQAGWLAPLAQPVWDSSFLLSEDGPVGLFFNALIGYISRPSGMQLVFWLTTLLVIGSLMILTRRQLQRA